MVLINNLFKYEQYGCLKCTLNMLCEENKTMLLSHDKPPLLSMQLRKERVARSISLRLKKIGGEPVIDHQYHRFVVRVEMQAQMLSKLILYFI